MEVREVGGASFYDRAGVGVDYAHVLGIDAQVTHAPQQRITTATENPNVQFGGIGQISGKVPQGEFIPGSRE